MLYANRVSFHYFLHNTCIYVYIDCVSCQQYIIGHVKYIVAHSHDNMARVIW